MSRFLQVFDIFGIWICHIFDFFWMTKVISTPSKTLMQRDGGGDNNKFYVKNIYNFYVIVTSRRKLDGFKW